MFVFFFQILFLHDYLLTVCQPALQYFSALLGCVSYVIISIWNIGRQCMGLFGCMHLEF